MNGVNWSALSDEDILARYDMGRYVPQAELIRRLRMEVDPGGFHPPIVMSRQQTDFLDGVVKGAKR